MHTIKYETYKSDLLAQEGQAGHSKLPAILHEHNLLYTGNMCLPSLPWLQQHVTSKIVSSKPIQNTQHTVIHEAPVISLPIGVNSTRLRIPHPCRIPKIPSMTVATAPLGVEGKALDSVALRLKLGQHPAFQLASSTPLSCSQARPLTVIPLALLYRAGMPPTERNLLSGMHGRKIDLPKP